LLQEGDADENSGAILMLAALDTEPETCEDSQEPIDIRAFTHQSAIAPRHQKPRE